MTAPNGAAPQPPPVLDLGRWHVVDQVALEVTLATWDQAASELRLTAQPD